jgi:hypothetical protein
MSNWFGDRTIEHVPAVVIHSLFRRNAIDCGEYTGETGCLFTEGVSNDMFGRCVYDPIIVARAVRAGKTKLWPTIPRFIVDILTGGPKL